MQFWRKAGPVASLWGAIALAYSNVYDNAFLYDDEFLIQKNQFIRSTSGIWKSFLVNSTAGSGGRDSFYRPMQGLLYTLIYQVFGLSTFGFHLLNLTLHSLTATALFFLTKRLGFKSGAAWVTAFLWCLHPLHTEAVTYQSATADSLYTLFILLGLIQLVPNFSRLGASCFFLAALGSKESAIVFPLLAMTCLFWLSQERWSPKTYLKTWPLWSIAGIYLLARHTILDFDHTFQFYRAPNIYSENIVYRTYTFLATLPLYAFNLVWPHDLHMDRSFPVFTEFLFGPVMLGAVLFMLAALALWQQRNKPQPALAFAVLWFASSHVPHAGVLLPVNAIFLEHWMYLPSMGFFIWLGQWLTSLSLGAAFPRTTYAAIAFVGLALGVVTFMQNEVWETPVTFYSNTLRYEAKVARVHNNLAMAYSDQGKVNEAIAEYQQAIAVSDTYPQTHHNLALALASVGRIPEAIQHLQRALEMDREFYPSAGALAEIYTNLGDAERANTYHQLQAQLLQHFAH